METALSSWVRRVTVTEIISLHPSLKKIRFAGEFSSVRFEVGQAVILRINDTDFRNYTPAHFDSKAGTCEVLFHLHGNGPGSAFIDSLQPGSTLLMGLPRGFSVLKKSSPCHFFYGDETTLGLFYSCAQVLRHTSQQYGGILEFSDLSSIPDGLGLDLPVVEKKPGTAAPAISYLDQYSPAAWEAWKKGTFYLMGNALSIQQFRKALKERGVGSSHIVTQPYWAAGKIGL